jgi:26S proteasome regulatory subunit N2
MALQRNVQKNLAGTIKRIFESCYQSGDYKQVVGIAIEARNLEVLKEAIVRVSRDEKKHGKKPVHGGPSKSEELMEYVLDICMNVVQERGLRNEVGPPINQFWVGHD